MTHVASRTRPSLFLRVTLKGGCGLGTRLCVAGHDDQIQFCMGGPYSKMHGNWPVAACYFTHCDTQFICQES